MFSEAQFIHSTQFLDRGLALTSAAAGVIVFFENHFQRLAAVEIFRATGVTGVLLKAALEISGNSRVQ